MTFASTQYVAIQTVTVDLGSSGEQRFFPVKLSDSSLPREPSTVARNGSGHADSLVVEGPAAVRDAEDEGAYFDSYKKYITASPRFPRAVLSGDWYDASALTLEGDFWLSFSNRTDQPLVNQRVWFGVRKTN